ncbi:MAG: hypothetical protein FJZ59_04425 [Chlamydiae bacterium]|nr:hypothetical protein [Chlamydiota bacterium]
MQIKREREETAPIKAPAPLKIAKCVEDPSDRFKVDLKKPLTIKGTGSHFSDFREALKALAEKNYPLALEYIVLLARFFDIGISKERRFPPALACDIHLKTYFCIVYYHISMMISLDDSKKILSEHKLLLEELEIHRIEIKAYLERYNPIEQITPFLESFKQACVEAFNLKLMSLEEVRI